jgi:flavin-dependent dehydrogenase
MARGDGSPLFARFVARVADAWGIPPGSIGQPLRRYLPLSPLSRTFTHRVLAVGDAAGLVKPTTGGGIFYSLVSASLAADVLSDALRTNRHDEATLSAYQGAWRKQLGPELRSQLALRMLAQRLTDVEIDAFFQLARTNGVMPLVKKVAAFNQHRHLIAELFQHAPARRLLFRRFAAS